MYMSMYIISVEPMIHLNGDSFIASPVWMKKSIRRGDNIAFVEAITGAKFSNRLNGAPLPSPDNKFRNRLSGGDFSISWFLNYIFANKRIWLVHFQNNVRISMFSFILELKWVEIASRIYHRGNFQVNLVFLARFLDLMKASDIRWRHFDKIKNKSLVLTSFFTINCVVLLAE